MSRKKKKISEKLADEHWKYIEDLIRIEVRDTFNNLETYLDAIRFHYKTAFIHGFKHGEK